MDIFYRTPADFFRFPETIVVLAPILLESVSLEQLVCLRILQTSGDRLPPARAAVLHAAMATRIAHSRAVQLGVLEVRDDLLEIFSKSNADGEVRGDDCICELNQRILYFFPEILVSM